MIDKAIRRSLMKSNAQGSTARVQSSLAAPVSFLEISTLPDRPKIRFGKCRQNRAGRCTQIRAESVQFVRPLFRLGVLKVCFAQGAASLIMPVFNCSLLIRRVGMSINRKIWKPPFRKLPSWPCPNCASGSLVARKDTLKQEETGPSIEAHQHEAWEPEWVEERFTGLLVCQNSACGEIVAIGGHTRQVENHDWEHQERNWDREFEPTFISPAPPIFLVPEKCPESVVTELAKAFALFWFDRGSCANRLRSAIEALLTDRKIPRTRVNKKKKREPIALHERIIAFQKTSPDAGNYLLAIKWLGNAGSHNGLDEFAADDLLDGFELFEHVIDLVYVHREKQLKKIARSINSRKGRPSKARKNRRF